MTTSDHSEFLFEKKGAKTGQLYFCLHLSTRMLKQVMKIEWRMSATLIITVNTHVQSASLWNHLFRFGGKLIRYANAMHFSSGFERFGACVTCMKVSSKRKKKQKKIDIKIFSYGVCCSPVKTLLLSLLHILIEQYFSLFSRALLLAFKALIN